LLGSAVAADFQFALRGRHVLVEQPLKAQGDPLEEIIALNGSAEDEAIPFGLERRLLLQFTAMLAKKVFVFLLRVGGLALAQSVEVVALVSSQEVGFALIVKINGGLPEVELFLLEAVE